MLTHRLLKSLAAVVLGNLLYLLAEPHLPPAARHHPFQLDLGLLVDAWFCLASLGIIEIFAGNKPSRGLENSSKE